MSSSARSPMFCLSQNFLLECFWNKAENEHWIEEISNFKENYKTCIVDLIQKMSDLLDPSPQSSKFNRSYSQKEISFNRFGSNHEIMVLKKSNDNLKEWVLSLENENKSLEEKVTLLQNDLNRKTKENEDLYLKYESVSKNKDYSQIKSEWEKLETLLENKDRHIKEMEIQTKNEIQRIQDKYNEIKQELDLKNEKLLKKRNEVNQLNIYKRMAGRMEEVDKLNLDLKNTISQFKDEVKEKERIIRQKELEITSLNVWIDHRNNEIKSLKDKIVELEGEITHQKNIKVDLLSKIDKISTELERWNEELDDRNKRLEYAEQINFNEYSNDDLNFDLSERIKFLEEQNEELKKNQDHKKNLVIEELETKLDELENEKKQLMRVNQKTQIKYERYEKEREAKMLAKDKIKLLQKELNIANIDK